MPDLPIEIVTADTSPLIHLASIEELSDDAKAVLRRYASGEISAEVAAWEIWHRKLSTDPNPRAVDVILWSKACGFGIPAPEYPPRNCSMPPTAGFPETRQWVNLARSDTDPTDAQLQALIGQVAADVKMRALDANARLMEAIAAEIDRAATPESEVLAHPSHRAAG